MRPRNLIQGRPAFESSGSSSTPAGLSSQSSRRIGPEYQVTALPSPSGQPYARKTEPLCLWSPSAAPPESISSFVKAQCDENKLVEVDALAILQACGGDVVCAGKAAGTITRVCGLPFPDALQSVIGGIVEDNCATSIQEISSSAAPSLPQPRTVDTERVYRLAVAAFTGSSESCDGVSLPLPPEWTTDEVASFETAVTTWGRGDFTRVSRLLGTKSTSEVVSRYYNTWKRNSASYTAFRAAHPMKDVERRGAHDADRMGRSWFHLWKMPREIASASLSKVPISPFMSCPIDNEPYCCLCGDGGDIILCEGDCRRSYHVTCLSLVGEPVKMGDPKDPHVSAYFDTNLPGEWKCYDCRSGSGSCFVCGGRGRVGCHIYICARMCGKSYHIGCLPGASSGGSAQPQACTSDPASLKPFVCPFHTCATCGQEFDAFHPTLYLRCHVCPTAYHELCAPAGIKSEVDEVMQCPRPHDNPAFRYPVFRGNRIGLKPLAPPATEKKPSQPKKRVKVKQIVTVVKPPVLTSAPAVQVPVSVPIAVPATEEWPIPVNPKAALHTVLAGILSKRDCTQPISLKEIRIQAEKELGSSLAECRDDIKDFASQFLDAALARNASAAGGPPASSPADYAAQQHSASGTDSDSSSSDATADFSRPKTVSGPVFFGFANPIVQQGIRSKPDIAEALRTLDPTMTIPEVPSGLDYNVFPFAADSRLLVDNWGTLQCKSPEWCVTGRYIIPVGLKLRTKPYAGGDFVECSVSEGESGLVYTCRLQDGRSFESSYSSNCALQAKVAMYEIMKASGGVDGRGRRGRKRKSTHATVPPSSAPPHIFGFRYSTAQVQRLLLQLPGAERAVIMGNMLAPVPAFSSLPPLPHTLSEPREKKEYVIRQYGSIPTDDVIRPLLSNKYIIPNGFTSSEAFPAVHRDGLVEYTFRVDLLDGGTVQYSIAGDGEFFRGPTPRHVYQQLCHAIEQNAPQEKNEEGKQ